MVLSHLPIFLRDNINYMFSIGTPPLNQHNVKLPFKDPTVHQWLHQGTTITIQTKPPKTRRAFVHNPHLLPFDIHPLLFSPNYNPSHSPQPLLSLYPSLHIKKNRARIPTTPEQPRLGLDHRHRSPASRPRRPRSGGPPPRAASLDPDLA